MRPDEAAGQQAAREQLAAPAGRAAKLAAHLDAPKEVKRQAAEPSQAAPFLDSSSETLALLVEAHSSCLAEGGLLGVNWDECEAARAAAGQEPHLAEG